MEPHKRITVVGLSRRMKPEPHWLDLSGRARTEWQFDLSEYCLGEVRLQDGRVAPRLKTALDSTLIHPETWDAEARRPTDEWMRSELEAIRTGRTRFPSLPYWTAIGHWDGTRLLTEAQARRWIRTPLTRQAILNSPSWPQAIAWRDSEDDPIIWHHGSFEVEEGRSHLDAAMNSGWPFTIANVIALMLEHENDWDELLAEWDRRLDAYPNGCDWEGHHSTSLT